MSLIDDYVADALTESGIIAETLPPIEGSRIHDLVAVKFSRGRGRCLWERLLDCTSVQREDAWMWLSKFIRHEACLLFFDMDDSTRMYKFESGYDLVAMLTDAYGFVFYVTDTDANYVIAFNDHDYLIACGPAKVWLARHLQSLA